MVPIDSGSSTVPPQTHWHDWVGNWYTWFQGPSGGIGRYPPVKTPVFSTVYSGLLVGLKTILLTDTLLTLDTQNIYYCYVWKREDGTPYYIGKGKGSRAFITNGRIVSPPRDRNNIFFACEGVSETEAFEMETALISLLGRKDLGTGILRNRTDGGEGISNPGEGTRQKIGESNKRRIVSKKTKLKMSKSHKGRTYSEETIQRMREGSTGIKHPEGSKSKVGKKGENNHNSKLTDVQRIEIYQRWKSGELQKDLAIYYHVSFCTIQRTIKKLKS